MRHSLPKRHKGAVGRLSLVYTGPIPTLPHADAAAKEGEMHTRVASGFYMVPLGS